MQQLVNRNGGLVFPVKPDAETSASLRNWHLVEALPGDTQRRILEVASAVDGGDTVEQRQQFSADLCQFVVGAAAGAEWRSREKVSGVTDPEWHFADQCLSLSNDIRATREKHNPTTLEQKLAWLPRMRVEAALAVLGYQFEIDRLKLGDNQRAHSDAGSKN